MPSMQRDRGPPAGAVRSHGKHGGLPDGFRWRGTGLRPALRVNRQRPCGAPSGSTRFPQQRALPGKRKSRFPHRPLPKANQQQHLIEKSTSGTAALRWPLLLHHLTGLRLILHEASWFDRLGSYSKTFKASARAVLRECTGGEGVCRIGFIYRAREGEVSLYTDALIPGLVTLGFGGVLLRTTG